MSEQIQAISQGNYILHNIDAKKLYVQEPLFTANSGDAVYVGWRPDETVLWSGSIYDDGTSANLSESYKNFDRLGITYNIQESTGVSGYVEVPTDGTMFNISHDFLSFTDNTFAKFYTNLTANSNTTLSVNRHIHYWVANTSTTISRGSNGLVIRKITGVNRKENA